MAYLLAFGAFILIFWLVKRAGSKGAPKAGVLPQGALRGRGLVLASSQQAIGVTRSGRRYEQRQMTVDVEVPGREPYIVQKTFLVPRGVVEAIPGASLELSVDSNDPQGVEVLGPGGFTGSWLRTGPPQPY